LLPGDSAGVEYRFTFCGPRELEFFEYSTCSAKPRLWKHLPLEIARDIIGYEEAMEASEIHYDNLGSEDSDHGRLLAWDGACVARGIKRGH
jgi:hypothetical protein